MSRFIKKERDIKRIFITIGIVALTAIVSVFLYDMYIRIETNGNHKFGTYTVNTVSTQNGNSGNSAENVDNLLEYYKIVEDNTVKILENVTDTVVGISKIKNIGNSVFTLNSAEDLNLGSGVIVSSNGYILSNWHVTGDKLSKCYVTLASGANYEGTVVWADSDLDLSIVKIEMINLPFAELSDSDNLKIGQSVFAIGNPIGFEFQRTVTQGIISAVNRTIKLEEGEEVSYLEDLIQTDATINPGNSGGPLIDIYGKVVAINTIKITSAEGIGFAVPINLIKPIIESFVQTGEFKEATLGMYGFDREVIPYLDADINFNGEKGGIYVAKVVVDGPLYKASVKAGDVLLKIDGIDVNKITTLRSYIYTKKPEDVVNLTILRNNREMNVTVTLKERGIK